MTARLQIQRHKFASINGLRQAVNGAHFAVDQQTSQPVIGHKVFANLDGAMLSSGQFSGDLRIRGAFSERDFSFGILLGEGHGCRFWRRRAQQDYVGLFPPGKDHDAFYRSGASYAGITLSEELLLTFAAKEGLSFAESNLRSRAIVPDCQEIGQILRETVPLMAKASPGLLHTGFGSEIRDRLLVAFLNRMNGPDTVQGRAALPHLPRPEKIVNDALAIIESELDRALTIHELATILEVSRSSLNRAFISVTSFPPSAYMRIHRLNGVRRALQYGGVDAKNPVTAVAMTWGFTHLGHFSYYYKQLFGESPSETLRSAGRSNGDSLPSFSDDEDT